MKWLGPDALAVVRPTGAYLLDFFFSSIQFLSRKVSSCMTTVLSKVLTPVLLLLKKHVIKYFEKIYECLA